jgi:hypothetical protein
MAVLMAERIERPPSLFGQGPEHSVAVVQDAARARDGGLSGGLTLDDAIVGVWEGLAAQVVVACPVCDGALRPRAAPDIVGGCCEDCGASLS